MFHTHFTVHKLHVKLPDLHGDRLENEFTWYTILQIGNNSDCDYIKGIDLEATDTHSDL